MQVVQERYALIGGASPLPGITGRQAAALQAHLGKELPFAVRVRHGFLYTEPTVADCLERAHAATRSSRSPSARSPRGSPAAGTAPPSTRPSRSPAAAAPSRCSRAGTPTPTSSRPSPATPRSALDCCDNSEWMVLFTAHNVPAETIWEGDPYVEQLQQTIAQLIPGLMPGDWKFGFQSTGRGGGEWMEPEVADVVREIAGEGWKKVLVVPVGFVSDNVETLYDLDILLKGEIEALGMEYRRADPPNDSPQFIKALADVVVQHLANTAWAAPGEAAARPAHALSRAPRRRGRGRPLRVAVIGGGMAGLGAARALEDARAADPSIDWHLLRGRRPLRRQGPHGAPRRLRRGGRAGLGHHREALADHHGPQSWASPTVSRTPTRPSARASSTRAAACTSCPRASSSWCRRAWCRSP